MGIDFSKETPRRHNGRSCKKFQLIDGDDDKMDAILAEMGASDQIRHLNKTVKPIVEYSREGDEYVAKATAPGLNKEHTHKFRLNVELDETTLDERKVKSTYKRVGNTLVQTEVWNGKTVTYERTIQGDDLSVTVTCGALVAKRKYKRV